MGGVSKGERLEQKMLGRGKEKTGNGTHLRLCRPNALSTQDRFAGEGAERRQLKVRGR